MQYADQQFPAQFARASLKPGDRGGGGAHRVAISRAICAGLIEADETKYPHIRDILNFPRNLRGPH